MLKLKKVIGMEIRVLQETPLRLIRQVLLITKNYT